MQNVKKTYRLFLDDIRIPSDVYRYTGKDMYLMDNWKIVRNYKEFVSYIGTGWEKYNVFPEIISFDHDLADEHYCPMHEWDNYAEWEKSQFFKEKNGYKCAEWLVDYCMDNKIELCEYYGHSMNPVGKENIRGLLDNFKKHQNK